MKSEVLVLIFLGVILGVENGPNTVEVPAKNENIETLDESIGDYLEIDRKKGSKKGKKPKKLKPKPNTKPTKPLKPKPKPTKPTKPAISESYETEMLKQLDLSTALINSNLNSKDEENCTEELKALLKTFKNSEDRIEKFMFKKPFIRSTELTTRLGKDSRLFFVLKETIKRVSSRWTSVGGGEKMIKFFSQEFLKWVEKGGGLSVLQTKKPSAKSEDGDVNCAAYLHYRRMDGKCNNLANKHQGSAAIALRRFFPSRYEDGFSIPRGGFHTSSLPSARVVSRKIHHASEFPNPVTTKGFTHMVMQFGQFLDHDITLTADMEIDCCNPEILLNDQNNCFNIDITGDDFYSGKTTCHAFSRSLEVVTDTAIREQINGITAYIDASNVYGSDDVLAKKLRTLVDGRLKTHADGPMLPTRRQANLESHGPAQLDEDLVAGDIRAIEQPTLASIHSLFLSEHNRIADELRLRLSVFLSDKTQSEQDEIIYQEARKLVGAEMQNIVYSEFLPIVLGQDEFSQHNLQLSTVTTYNDTIDASIRNEFATVAFRFGHSLIAGLFNGNGGHRLKLTYFDEDPEFVSGRRPNNNGTAWYSELEECARQRSSADDVLVTEDVTNFLFSNTRGAATNFGGDLPARNIQRGRDHGLPSYNEFRSSCGLISLKDFHTRPVEIKTKIWKKLKNTYESVDDIDAWTGGLAETAPSDGLVGPTFACIIGRQFNFLKFGDRFFFNNYNANGLKVNSRKTVRQRLLGDIICDNTNAISLQKYVMKEEDSLNNPQQKCTSRNALNYDAIVVDITSEETNGNLEEKVMELESSVEMIKADLQSVQAALNAKCDTTICSNIHAKTIDIENCLGDVSSLDCPLSPFGKTGLSAALSEKCEASTCESLQTAAPNQEMLNPVVLLTGGFGTDRSVEVFSLSGHCNKDLEDLPDENEQHTTNAYKGDVILCGGSKTRESCLYMDNNQRFVTHSQLIYPQRAHVGAVVNDKLVLAGGGVSALVESWDGSQWQGEGIIKEIEDLRLYSCAAAINEDTFLMAGGWYGNGKRTNKMFKYSGGVWERMEDFPGPARSQHGCAFVETPQGGAFLIAGGADGDNWRSSYLYNIGRKQWEKVGDLIRSRHAGRMVVVEGRVLMVGGSGGGVDVEEYDVKTKSWSIIPHKMKRARANFGAAIVPGALVGCQLLS